MPANENLSSALAVHRGDLLEARILQNLWSAVDQRTVGRHLYASLVAELPEFGLTEEGMTLHLIDGRNDWAFINDVLNLDGVEVWKLETGDLESKDVNWYLSDPYWSSAGAAAEITDLFISGGKM